MNASPYPKDGARQSDEDRTNMFLACLKAAIRNGFYADAFGQMDDRHISGLAANYIANHTENLTIFDPHFLECLYGDNAVRKAHWLIELRMRKMDIVPAMHKDLFTVTIKPEREKPAEHVVNGAKLTLDGKDVPVKNVQIDLSDPEKAFTDLAASLISIMGTIPEPGKICPTCCADPCSCKKDSDAKQS